MQMRTRRLSIPLLSLMLLGAAAASPGALASSANDLVAPATLEKLLPVPEGWTKGLVRSKEVEISKDCSYTVVSVSYTKDGTTVKLTLADTGAHQEGLMALAMMVVTLPDDYADQVPPATTIKRIKIDGSPAVETWDSEKLNGEIAVVVSGRFVAAVETSKADTLDTLKGILSGVNLKALGALK